MFVPRSACRIQAQGRPGLPLWRVQQCKHNGLLQIFRWEVNRDDHEFRASQCGAKCDPVRVANKTERPITGNDVDLVVPPVYFLAPIHLLENSADKFCQVIIQSFDIFDERDFAHGFAFAGFGVPLDQLTKEIFRTFSEWCRSRVRWQPERALQFLYKFLFGIERHVFVHEAEPDWTHC